MIKPRRGLKFYLETFSLSLYWMLNPVLATLILNTIEFNVADDFPKDEDYVCVTVMTCIVQSTSSQPVGISLP